MRDSDKYFKTSNFPLAVFLFAKDQKVSGVHSLRGDLKEFVFANDSPELTEFIELYKFGSRDDPKLSVPVHKYEQSRRELLDRLND